MTRALIVLVLCTPGFADEPRDPDVTLAYVSGSLRGTTATFAARYTVRLHGPTLSMGMTMLPMPEKASVTSLVVHAPDGEHELELLPAEKARKRLQDALIDSGAQRWAVLAERRHDTLDLSFAAPRTATITIDVAIEAPTCFVRDMRYVQIPLVWRASLSPSLKARKRGCVEAEDNTLFVGFPTSEATPDRIGTNAARVDLGDAHLARLEVVAASRLGEIPDDLATAILVDGSRSMSADRIEAQRELVKAYARAAGTTQIQLIAYARTARALLPGWTSARLAKIDRALANLAPRNGSNIDVGIAEAVRWLAHTNGTKRIVLVTDEQYSRRMVDLFTKRAFKLPPAVLLHVVAIAESGELRRDLTPLGNELAESTGGIAVRAGMPDDDTRLDATELLRPLRIDRFEITAPGWRRSSALTTNCDSELEEGMACSWLGEGDVVAGPLAASGFIWGKKWSRVVTPDPARATELARALLREDILEDRAFDRAQQIARAANSGWSFYGEWGGPGGYRSASVMHHGGSRCCGRVGRLVRAPHVVIGRIGPGVLPELDLVPQLSHVIGLCNLGDAHVEAEVETTLSEIVEVRVLAPPSVSRCVEDAIWDTAISVPPQLRQTNTRVVLVH